MKSVWFLILLVFAATVGAAYTGSLGRGEASRVSDSFIHKACRDQNTCGDRVTKKAAYNPFKRRDQPVTQDAEVLAMSAVRRLYKAAFRRDLEDDYVAKEARLLVQRGYPQDKRGEEMLRAAYKKSPEYYLKYAKKTAASNKGYVGYRRTWGGSLSVSGGSVGITLG